jgi:chromosome segregation ATPase
LQAFSSRWIIVDPSSEPIINPWKAEEKVMGDAKEVKDSPEKRNMDDEEYEHIVDELRELRELENMKTFLEVENGRLKTQIELLTGQLEGINIAISSTEASLVSLEKRVKRSSKNVEELESKRDLLMAEANNLHLQIKATREDQESSSNLKDSLKDELNDIQGEKTMVIKRLNDIKTGLEKISSDRDVKLPHLKGYESVLKQTRNVFKETQNRMEVSLMLRQK